MDETDNVDVENRPETEESHEIVNNSTNQEVPPEKVRFVRLPQTRVKHIMKADPDTEILSQDAVFLVTKATEIFIEHLAKQTVKVTFANKRKTVMKKDVDTAIDVTPELCFLDGALE